MRCPRRNSLAQEDAGNLTTQETAVHPWILCRGCRALPPNQSLVKGSKYCTVHRAGAAVQQRPCLRVHRKNSPAQVPDWDSTSEPVPDPFSLFLALCCATLHTPRPSLTPQLRISASTHACGRIFYSRCCCCCQPLLVPSFPFASLVPLKRMRISLLYHPHPNP